MKLRKGSLLLCLLSLLLAPSARAASTALVSVNGGGYVAIPFDSVDSGSTIYCGGANCTVPNTALDGPGWSLEALIIFTPYRDDPNNIAPNIDWSFHAVNDTGAALSLSFLFSQDIDPISTAGLVNTSYRLGSTNGGDSPGPVHVQQLAAPGGIPIDTDGIPEIEVFNLSTNGGGTLANAGIDLGQTWDSDPLLTSDTYPAENSPIVAGPGASGSYNFMRVDVNLSITNGGDEVNAFGSARVVPEPEVAALIGLGLIGLGYVGRRRHR